jgi:hypothetical protein
MVFNLFVQNIAQLISTPGFMSGGKMNKSLNNLSYSQQPNAFVLFFISLLLLLLKGFIVYILYNNFLPKIIYSLSDKKSLEDVENNFKNLNYMESILLVIFTNTLFT